MMLAGPGWGKGKMGVSGCMKTSPIRAAIRQFCVLPVRQSLSLEILVSLGKVWLTALVEIGMDTPSQKKKKKKDTSGCVKCEYTGHE